jgi:hypothetical protein
MGLILSNCQLGLAQDIATQKQDHSPQVAQQSQEAPGYRGALVRVSDVTVERLGELQKQGIQAIVLLLPDTAADDEQNEQGAAELVLAEGLELNYWLDVGRCVSLAEQHPEWMASLQTHDEWRRLFPETRQPDSDEVAKTYPWVPILSREPFAAQLERTKRALLDLPRPSRIYLNHLQGAPSACGCGNTLCRWTSDYGKKRTTTPLGDDAAALFVRALKKVVSGAEIVPVWTTECEERDGHPDGQCAGVGCFDGICWKAWTRQLMPISDECPNIAALALYKSMQRDDPYYGTRAAWVGEVVKFFSSMPSKEQQPGVAAERLTVVLQGWDVTADELQSQIQVAGNSQAGGYIIDYTRLDQGWQPKIINWR